MNCIFLKIHLLHLCPLGEGNQLDFLVKSACVFRYLEM